ncbi:MAG: hypothetical protein RH917_07885 [Lacipirellulaceae bacterium]
MKHMLQAHMPMFVLDVLQYDIEQINSVINLLNDSSGSIGWSEFCPDGFRNEDVIQVLKILASLGHVDVYQYSEEESCLVPSGEPGFVPDDLESAINDYWFLRTRSGEKRWEEWDPPTA